ncbi:hypothetical protein K431DRAFT_288373 [Polychaeton citri CBS 116435]|uniref:AMMECR1 domain-containing protein n=1 Tax=Polychaeton citri CBS 116435 TaxID=1314669 RepID=A0A9P4Q433_9PEZI|nr:hypothetical protein K431DRAFT_288373 [Polychaeton citri CBS 116435]
MATQAHCAYCFESLAASFEQRQPLSLAQVEDLWEQYHATDSKVDKSESPSQPQQDEEGEVSEDGDDDDAEMTEAETDEPVHPKPAAISRLLNSKSQSATSSSSSLHSTESSNSSSKAQSSSASEASGGTGTQTPASSLSSRSSLFSFGKKRQQQKEDVKRTSQLESHPLFVTWNLTSKSGHKNLRGCIGTFEPQELDQGLRSYALTSAFEDMRFSPIPASQLPTLSCDVTLLTDFSQPTEDGLDWELGKHGIRISFYRHGRRYGATYLPSVAHEQGWTKEETMVSLMRKAGWNGSGSGAWLKTWKEGKGELVRYEGKKIELSYSEWKPWREWVDSIGVKTKTLN